MREIDVIEVGGSAYDRGRVLGSRRRSRIEGCLADWLASLRQAGIVEPRAYLESMLEESTFMESVWAHLPDLLEEIAGIADGAGQPFKLIFCFQLMDEEWAYRQKLYPSGSRLDKCSAVALKDPDGAMLIGQNVDLPPHMDGHQIVVRLAGSDAEPGALLLSAVGMIALCGINTQGVAVCVNAIPQLAAAQVGIPVAFVIRKLLKAHSLSDAIEWLRTLPHATPQHYLMANSGEIRSYEVCSAGIAEIGLTDGGRFFHTNHPMALHAKRMEPPTSNSVNRLQQLVATLGVGHPNLASLKAALASTNDLEHPISRCKGHSMGRVDPFISGAFTMGSMISRIPRVLQMTQVFVSAGPPSEFGFTDVGLWPERLGTYAHCPDYRP